MLYLLDDFRDPIYYGALPSWTVISASLGIGVVVLACGYAIFARCQDSFVFYV